MNNITIDSDISYWGYSARWLSNKLADMTGDLEVSITSYGGDVFEGIDMFNQLRKYSKEKGHVTTVVGSKAMSIASLLLLAGDTRKAYNNSTIMIHKSWTWLAGNADELLSEAKILNGIDTILANQYGKHMDQTKEEIMKVMSEEGWYVGQEQIETTNFIDEFIVQDEEVEVSAKSNYKKAMARFSAKAQEDNIKPDFAEVKALIVECNDGKCPMDNSGVNHSSLNASAQIENSTKGNSMEYTKEKFEALEASHAEALTGANAKLESAETVLATVTADKEKTDSALKALQTTMDAKAEVLPEIAAMAYARGVDEKTLVAMVSAKDLDSAKVACHDGMNSEGAFGAQHNSQTNSVSAESGWGQILGKKES